MRLRLLSLLLAIGLSALSATAEKKQQWVTGQVLVKYKSGFAPEAGKHGVKKSKSVFGRFKLKGKAKQSASARGLDRIYLLEVHDVSATIESLSKDPAVEYAEPNWLLRLAAIPNDPSYATQWSLAKIGAPQAWDTATSGSGVVVGVVDTGIDLTHPDLAANLWTNPGEIAGNGIDDDDNGFVDDVHGWDFGDGDADPADELGHGTYVAGVIGAVGNNATGISGVAWSAKLAALRIGNIDSSAAVDAALQAVEYANAMGFRITSHSYGWWEGGYSWAFDDVVAAAEAQGNLFIVGAGNDAHDNDQLPEYPAHYANPNVLSVTSTTATDGLSSFSNYGAVSVDLGAPGSNIETTARGGGYANVSGTSLAAPLVAGAAAVYWTAHPSLTAVEVRDALLLHTDPLPALNQTTVSGGRLSLANLFDTETATPAAISDLTVLDASFRSVTLRFTATGDDGMTGRAARYDVRVATSPLTESTWAQATQLTGEPIPALPGTLETFRLTGLTSSTTYYAGVRALDNAGNAGALSNVATFTTTRAAVIFDDNVEGGARDWTAEGLWHVQNGAWRYATASGNYNTGAANRGSLTSRDLDLTNATDARLQFRHDLLTERRWGRDVARVQLSADGGAWQTVLVKMSTDFVYRAETIDLSAYAGHHLRVRFDFDTIDDQVNQYFGWAVDDLRVEATSSNAPPTAAIGAPVVTEEQPATLSSAGSSDPEGAALEYKWSFGDGTYAYTTAATVSHAWAHSGSHTVTLVAFDGSNVSDPVTTTVSPIPVNDRPTIGIWLFDPLPYAEETSKQVYPQNASDEEGSPLTCRYDWGDGETTNPGVCESWTHAWNAPGTYTVTLIANDGELDSLPATIQIPIVEVSNDKPVARPGGPYDAHPNETVTLNGSASSDEETSIASFLWTFPDGTTSAAAQPSKAFGSGKYEVPLVVTDQTGLASTAAKASVRVCGGATANFFFSEMFTCPGGAAKIGLDVQSAIPPLTLTWTDGYVQQLPSLFNNYYAERVVTPSARTVYGLSSLTDFLGCAGTTGSGTIAVDFASATLPNNTRVACPGQPVTLVPALRGAGPFTLTWSDGFTQTGNGTLTRTVSPAVTTVYSIASMICASCPPGTNGLVSGITTVEVTEPLVATVSGGGTSCNGSSATVTATIAGGTPPFTIAWSDGMYRTESSRVVTRNVSPAATTTYSITSITCDGCTGTSTGSATVTRWNGTLPAVTNVSGSTTMCPNAPPVTLTANLSGDGLPFTLTWSDGFVQTVGSLTATRTVDPAAMTTYAVTSIRNAAGCNGSVSGSGNATVWRTTAPTASISGGGAFCPGTPQTINITLTGNAPWNVTWNDGFTQTIGSSPAARNVTPTVETTYFITGVTGASCSGTASGSVTFTPRTPPTATVSGGGGYCPGTSATLTATLTGTAPFQVTWSDGFTQSVPTGNVATRNVSAASSTFYSVSIIRDAYCYGTSSGNAQVYPRSVPAATVGGGGLSCAVGGGARITANVTGGVGPYSITWSDGVTQSGVSNYAERRVSPAATTTYTLVSVQDSYCSGTSSGSAVVTAATGPSAVVTGGGAFCSGGSTTLVATLTGTAPFYITWSDGASQSSSGNTATRSVWPSSQTVYTLTYVSDATCAGTSTGSAIATPVTPPSAVVSGGGMSCSGAPVTITASLSGTGPFDITWNDGFTQQESGPTATRTVSPIYNATYSITSLSNAGCSGTANGSATVTQRPTPAATVSGGGTYCEGATTNVTATLTGTAPFTLTWSDGVTQTTSASSITRAVGPSVTTVYTLTAVSDSSCSGTSSGSATATPTLKPVITQQPQNQTIVKRTATTLTVTATGSGLSYQWYQGPTGTTSTPVGTNSSSFITPKLTATTQYWVKIWKSGCTSYPANSQTATITVQ